MINYWIYKSFLAIIGLCGVLVIISRSPINSVLFLCGLYLAGGGIFLLLDHYFLGLTLIIVYVGAIAILFLFTIFMINVRITIQLGNLISPILAFVLLIGSLSYFIMSGTGLSLFQALELDSSLLLGNEIQTIFTSDWSHLLNRSSDLTMLANMIFHAYPLALILVGFLLLVVMIAIIKIHLDTH